MYELLPQVQDAREAVRSREIAEVNSTHLASALSEAKPEPRVLGR